MPTHPTEPSFRVEAAPGGYLRQVLLPSAVAVDLPRRLLTPDEARWLMRELSIALIELEAFKIAAVRS